MTDSVNQNEIERLGRSMGERARARPAFIASAMATWDDAHPDRSARAMLGCDEAQAWRLAVTPRPAGPTMVAKALQLSEAIGIDSIALVNILRFAESAEAFSAVADDGAMLMAALDAEEDDR